MAKEALAMVSICNLYTRVRLRTLSARLSEYDRGENHEHDKKAYERYSGHKSQLLRPHGLGQVLGCPTVCLSRIDQL